MSQRRSSLCLRLQARNSVVYSALLLNPRPVPVVLSVVYGGAGQRKDIVEVGTGAINWYGAHDSFYVISTAHLADYSGSLLFLALMKAPSCPHAH